MKNQNAPIKVPRDLEMNVVERYNSDRPCTLDYPCVAFLEASARPLPGPKKPVPGCLIAVKRCTMQDAENTIRITGYVIVGPDQTVDASIILYNARAR